MKEYNYSKFAKQVADGVKSSLEKSLGDININEIIQKVLGKIQIDISQFDIDVEGFSKVLENSLRNALTKTQSKINPKKMIDISSYISLNESQLFNVMEDLVDQIEDALDKENEKLAKDLQKSFVHAMSVAIGKNFKPPQDLFSTFENILGEKFDATIGDEVESMNKFVTEFSKNMDKFTPQARRMAQDFFQIQEQVHQNTEDLKAFNKAWLEVSNQASGKLYTELKRQLQSGLKSLQDVQNELRNNFSETVANNVGGGTVLQNAIAAQENYRAQLELTQQKLDELEEHANSLASELSLTNEQLSRAELDKDYYEEAANAGEREITNLSERLDKLKNDLREARLLNDRLLSSLEQQENTSDYYSNKSEELEIDIINLENTIRRLEKEKQTLQNLTKQPQASNQNINNEIDQQQKLGDAIEQNQQAINELNNIEVLSTLSEISNVLKEISKTLGTIDDNNGFQNILQSVKDLLAQLDTMYQKIGTGVYNIQIHKGADKESVASQEQTNNYIRDTRARYQNAYQKVVAKAGGEEMLFTYINSAINFRGGIDALYESFSKVNVQQIQSAEEQIKVLMNFFGILREAMQAPGFDLDLKKIKLPSDDDKLFRQNIRKKSITQTPETEVEAENLEAEAFNKANESLNNIIDKLEEIRQIISDLGNNNPFEESINNILNTINELITKFDTIDSSIFSDQLQQLQNQLDVYRNNQTELQSQVDLLNQELEKEKAITEELKQQKEIVNAEVQNDSQKVQFYMNPDILDQELAQVQSIIDAVKTKNEQFQLEQKVVEDVVDAEIHKLIDLKKIIEIEIPKAIAKKNEAFNHEGIVVDKVVEHEKKKLNDLENTQTEAKQKAANKQKSAELNELEKAYRSLTNTEERYAVLMARLNDGQKLNAKQSKELSSLEVKRQGYIDLIETMRQSGVVSDELENKYQVAQRQNKQIAESFIKNEYIESATKKLAQLKGLIASGQYETYSTKSASNYVNATRDLGSMDLSKIKDVVSALEKFQQSFVKLEKNPDSTMNAKIQQLTSAYQGLINTEEEYVILTERLNDGQHLTATQMKKLDMLKQERQGYQDIINSINIVSNALDDIKNKYSSKQTSSNNIASNLIRNEYVDDFIKKLNKVKSIISSGLYTDASTMGASNFINGLPNVNALSINEMKKYADVIERYQQSFVKASEVNKTNAKDINKVESAYRGLIKTETEYAILEERVNDGQQLTANQQKKYEELKIERQGYINIINTIQVLGNELDELKSKYDDIKSASPNIASDLIKNEYIDDTLKKISKLEKLIDSDKYTKISTKAAKDYLEQLNKVNIKSLDVDSIKKYNQELDKLLNKTLEKAGNETKLQKLLNNVTDEMQKNSNMSKRLSNDFEQLRGRIQALLSSGNYTAKDIQNLTNEFISLDTQLIKSGKTGKTFFQTISSDIRSSSARMIAQYMSFQDLVRYARSAISAVADLDKALTQLKIVSNATQSELQGITSTAHEMAQALGSTTTEVVSSITEWRRLGKTLSDSKILAEQATKLATGGIMDINSATTALVSSMQAFDLQADEMNKVVDQYIYLGKTIARR